IDDFAGVVLRTADLHIIRVAGKIARAHFGAGLKAAGAGDDGARLQIIFAIGAADAHPVHAMLVAMQGVDRRAEANFDAHALRDGAPLLKLPDAPTRHVDGNAALEIALLADLG